MKKLLWRPTRISWQIHLVIALCAMSSLFLVEYFTVNKRQPYLRQKIEAERYMKQAIDVIRKYRSEHVGRINKKIDPTGSGMIGILTSPITSKEGNYEAKLTTVNPNWAAVMVVMLKKANVKNGSIVAVTFSGSFPAMNIAIMSAARAMNLKLVVISSISASSWGANVPSLTWLDMEHLLYEKGIFPYRSIAASIGGKDDVGRDMSEKGKKLLTDTIRKYNIPLLNSNNIKENIDVRMDLFRENAFDQPIAAYINSGGSLTAFGSLAGKKQFKEGLSTKFQHHQLMIDSIMSRFAKLNTPIIFIKNIKTLAVKYDLPIAPQKMPNIGNSTLYYKLEYNKILAGSMLILIISLLYIFIKLGVAFRIFPPFIKNRDVKPPEHMV